MFSVLNASSSAILEGCECEVWISGNWSKWELIDSRGNTHGLAPIYNNNVRLTEPMCIQESKKSVLVFLPYEEDVCVALRIYKPLIVSRQEMLQLVSMCYPCYTEYIASKYKRAMDQMMNSIQDVTQQLNWNVLIGRILQSALSVIPYDCVGVLWRYDRYLGQLVSEARTGEMGKEIVKMRIKPGEGIVGNTFLRGTSRLYNSWSIVLSDTSTMTPMNKQYLHESFNFSDIRSIISVPILINGQVECVLIVYQKGQIPLFTDFDLKLLQSFANQVSIVMSNVKLYEDLRHQYELLKKRDEIHAALMHHFLQNKGISVIVRELSRITGEGVILVDFIDNQWTPKDGKEKVGWTIEQLQELFHSCGTTDYITRREKSHNDHIQYLYPVVSSHQCLGYLIVPGTKGLAPIQLVALEQGVSVLALELMRKQSMVESNFNKSLQFFNELKHEFNTNTYRSKLQQMGLSFDTSLMVALLEFTASKSLYAVNILTVQLVSLLRDALTSSILLLAFGDDNRVTLLMNVPRQGDVVEIQGKLRERINRWCLASKTELFGGMGSARTGIDAINLSYQEAEKALIYQKNRSEASIISYTDIGVNRLFIQQPINELEDFISEVFRPLKVLRGQASNLEETLAVYMRSGMSASRAANKLHIHINTMYQRLSKIEEILNISFANHEHLLQMQLACYLKESFPSISMEQDKFE
ncbi:helix-turn-helix domain-containing protein [Paenibacillus illinoisensis]|uniref:helix-turn-helix domain-containing protein n=1 Tax=Paenibacillus illinoisensis TaxID=59845 RepID=UPI003D2A904F